jgi:hypothetical protein
VACYEYPDAYFEWVYECYSLQQGGYRIENNQLSLTEWKDIAVMRALLESRQEEQRLSNLSHELMTFMTAIRRR